MKLIFVRHSETEDNVRHVFQGKNDGKLTKEGIRQAKELGKELKEKHKKIDMIFCSPLGRCVETLENILMEYPIEGPVFMSKLIEERDFGEYTGAESVLVDWDELDKDSKINREMGVESLEDIKKRTNLFLEDLKLEDKNSTVLIVSHYGPIKMMTSIITGKELDRVDVENGSITVFEKFE